MNDKSSSMKRPNRSDSKYWNGTKDFNLLKFEVDLDDYIGSLHIKIEGQTAKIDQLIKDYERRFNSASEMIREEDMYEVEPHKSRIRAKKSVYGEIIRDLKKLKG